MLQKISVFIILFLSNIVGLLAQPCMEDYSYRRSVTVANASGAEQTGQLVEIRFEARSLIDDSKMLANCADIRFTDKDGNPLSHWVDGVNQKTNNQSAWVKLDVVPAGGNTIYMFYGNPSALPVSDESVFAEFDNLDNLNNWDFCGSTSLTSGKLTLGNGDVIKSKKEYTHDFAIDAYISNTTGDNTVQLAIGQINSFSEGFSLAYRPDDPSNGFFELTTASGSCPFPATTLVASATTSGEGEWSFYWKPGENTVSGRTPYVNMNSPVTPPANTTAKAKSFLSVSGPGSMEIDWIRVREINDYGIEASLSASEYLINSAVELSMASNAPFCAGNGNTLTIAASNITGATYQWSHDTDGVLPETTNTVNISNADAGNSGTYTVVVNIGSPSCATKTAQINVVVDKPVDVGQITADDSVCQTSNKGVVKLQNYTGDISGWQYRVNNTGLWLDMIITADSIEYDGLEETHSFRARIESGTCGSGLSGISTVTVSPATYTGVTTENVTVCENHTGNIEVSGHTGDILYWESSPDKTNWTKINHQQNTYQYTTIQDSTWFRAIVKSGVCQQLPTGTILISVNDSTKGGSVQEGTFVCAGSNKDTLVLRNNVGDIVRWEFAPTSTGPWSENSSHENYFIYQGLTNTTYYRALVESPGCPQKYSEADTVTVEPVPGAGELAGAALVCETGNAGNLELKSYTGKVVGWVSSFDKSSWTHLNHAYDTLNYKNYKQNRHFRVLVNTEHEVCKPDTSAIASIEVSQATVQGSLYSNHTVVCELQNKETIKLNAEVGEVVRWESSFTGEAPWSTINNTTDSLVFNNLESTTFYRAVVKSGACEQKITNPIEIHVDKASAGGAILGGTEVCETVNSGELALLNHTGSIALWEQSTDKLNWSTYPNVAGNILTYDSLPDTTYFRAIVKSGQCPYDTSVTAKITVNPLPDVAFLVNNVNLGDPAVFQNKSAIPGGNIQSWLWDFGDNESSASKNPSHKYGKEGNYHVRLTAFSNKGCVDSASRTVSVFGLPDVNFTFKNVCLFYEMNFTNTSGLSGTTTYTWSFGDGETASGANAAHKYKNPGSYDVTLKAVSASGGVDSIVKTVMVYQRAEPGFVSGNVCEGNIATFANHTTPTSLSFTSYWEFGNGKTDTRTDPEALYSAPGAYLVKLVTTTSQGCVDSIKKSIRVYPNPVVDFAVEDVPYRQPSVFLNQTTIPYGNLSYTWEFGDGETSDSTNPVYIYGAAGVYPVTLKAVSDSGCTASIMKTTRIFDLPVAKFSFNNVCLGDSVPFINESTIQSGSLSYEWSFGDENTSTEASPYHTFDKPGSYPVRLICISASGARDTVQHQVKVYGLPMPDFSFNEACDGFTTRFENQSSVSNGEIAGVLWDFGDGSNSVQFHPEKEFLNPGIYNVNLQVVSSDGCEQNSIKPVILHPNPLTDFSGTEVCYGDFTEFANTSSIDNTLRPYTLFYSWELGDGSKSVLKEPEYRYKNPGIYRVRLVASTNANCRDTLVRYIEVFALPEASAGEDTTVTKGFPVTLEATGGVFYEWLPETGLSDNAIPNPEARPMETTEYAVRIVDGNSCVNSDTLTVYVEDEMKIVPSNILTPNHNNQNDTWHIVNIDSYPEAELMIFDRWGKLVYETTDYQNDWTGLNRNGDILPDGTYYYVIRIRNGEEVVYKGAITILRDK